MPCLALQAHAPPRSSSNTRQQRGTTVQGQAELITAQSWKQGSIVTVMAKLRESAAGRSTEGQGTCGTWHGAHGAHGHAGGGTHFVRLRLRCRCSRAACTRRILERSCLQHACGAGWGGGPQILNPKNSQDLGAQLLAAGLRGGRGWRREAYDPWHKVISFRALEYLSTPFSRGRF
jgi:hypothetical protein